MAVVEPFGVGIVGAGTVGSGAIRLLTSRDDSYASKAGRPLVLKGVVVRDPGKPRPYVPRELVTTDLGRILKDPSVHAVVELVGGTTSALEIVLDSLRAGKHVVTANKALLAEHGTRVFGEARKADRVVAFEASVAGGVPVVAVLGQCLAANRISSVQGILNGTSNFVLTEMSERGASYAEAVAEAEDWATPRPTRRSTWTGRTPPPSSASWPGSPSASASASGTSRGPGSRASIPSI